jgi:hypothetical protein
MNLRKTARPQGFLGAPSFWRSLLFMALPVAVLLSYPGSGALAASPFAWESISFDGGPDVPLAGSVSGTINSTPVPSPNFTDLENLGMDFHVRWGSYVLPHLGVRFSVGYQTFSGSQGFPGFSALPILVGVTTPLYDPRTVIRTVIPYLAADLGPSFNSLSTTLGNAGTVSFAADAGAGILYALTDKLSFYGEIVLSYTASPISIKSSTPSTQSSLSSGPLWTMPVSIGVTYHFTTPGSGPES